MTTLTISNPKTKTQMRKAHRGNWVNNDIGAGHSFYSEEGVLITNIYLTNYGRKYAVGGLDYGEGWRSSPIDDGLNFEQALDVADAHVKLYFKIQDDAEKQPCSLVVTEHQI